MSAFKDWLNGLTSKSTPVDADELYLRDSSGTPSSKKLTWANVKAALKAYLDSVTTTLTNKRITPRVDSTTSSATPTINTDNVDVYKLTAQAVDITSFTTNLSGTPTDGQRLIVQITGTAARAITWGASFESSAVALPTTTVSTDMLTVELMWNAVTSKWRCVYVTSASGASPGGSTTQVQFNSSGAFGGSSSLTWDDSAKLLTVNGPASSATSTDIRIAGQGGDCQLGAYYGLLTVFNAGKTKGGRIGASNVTVTSDGFIGFAGDTGTSAVSSGGQISFNRLNLTTAQVVINESTSNLGDLKLRNLIGTGNLATGIVAKTADYTATANDGTIEVDASGAARTITLPAVTGLGGRIYIIKKTDSSGNAVTVDANASETIDGATTVSLASQYSTTIIQANAAGTAWHKLASI